MVESTVNWKDDSQRNHDIVYQFEKAFGEGKNPQVNDYLQGEGASRRQLLVELLHSDLELRIRAGQSLRVQDLLKAFPELAQQPDDVASLLKTEIRCLRQMGIYPMLHKYQAEYGAILGKRVEELFAQESRGTREAKIGSIIAGKYKLLAELGEGGMGSVYAAEQTQPVRRVVAIKLIKPGMDSSGVLARFEAERQALAMMDHPNIARMLDGGITEDGQPYFVMEQVKGLPITKFCDQEKMSLDNRLRLFMDVCQGVQHAHQKGIIHRDLKPSNILVTLIDGKPVPKVIDFGVAKALHQKLTDKTMYTEAGRMVGTLEYMAPEQADLNNLDVDTRADVYALGVVLYELLTGQVPFTGKELRSAAYDEMLRIIREMEPPRPSTKLSSSLDLPKVAAQRQVDPKQLTSVVAGELDWIVMKCLEKERSRRYETANALGRELGRYLADEPVEARPPSVGYRVGKFVRKNRGKLATAGLIVVALATGLVVSLWQMDRAIHAEGIAKENERLAIEERNKKEEERKRAEYEKQIAQSVKDFLQKKLLGQADARVQANTLLQTDGFMTDAKENPTIMELLDRAAKELEKDTIDVNFGKQPLLQAEILNTVGDTYRGIGRYEEAKNLLQRSIALREEHLGKSHPVTLLALSNLAFAYLESEDVHKSISLFEKVRDSQLKYFQLDHPDILETLNRLAWAYQKADRLTESILMYEQVVKARTKTLGSDHPETLRSQNGLSLAYERAGRLEEACTLLGQVSNIQIRILGPNHPDTLDTLSNLASCYSFNNRLPESISLFKQVRDSCVKIHGKEHNITTTCLHNLAVAYHIDGQYNYAIELYEQIISIRVKKYGAMNPLVLASKRNLADALLHINRMDEAVLLLEQIRDDLVKVGGTDFRDYLHTLQFLGKAYLFVGRLPEAIALLENTFTLMKAKFGPDSMYTLECMWNLASAYLAAGKQTKAISLSEEWFNLRKAKLGPEHPFIIQSMNYLGRRYQEGGQHTKAISLLEDAIKLMKIKLGPEHHETLTCMNNLANSYLLQGKQDEALLLYDDAIKIGKARLGTKHPVTLQGMHNLAMFYKSTGQGDKAISQFEETLKLMKEHLGPDHTIYLNCLSNLAFAYQTYGQHTNAILRFDEAYKITNAKLGVDHPETLNCMSNLADAYRVINQHAKVVLLLEKALNLQKSKLGAEHPRTLRTMSILASSYWALKQLDKSIPLFEEEVKHSEAKYGSDHPSTLIAMANLGVNMRDAGRFAEALPLLEVAHGNAKKSPSLKFIGSELLEAYAMAGKHEEVATLAKELVTEAHNMLFKDSSPPIAELTAIGRSLLKAKAFTAAEQLLRELLVVCENSQETFTLYFTQSLLGGALVGQKKYAEAQPLLLKGYEGFKKKRNQLSAQDFYCTEALDYLIQLYTETNKPDEMKKWQEEKANLTNVKYK